MYKTQILLYSVTDISSIALKMSAIKICIQRISSIQYIQIHYSDAHLLCYIEISTLSAVRKCVTWTLHDISIVNVHVIHYSIPILYFLLEESATPLQLLQH